MKTTLFALSFAALSTAVYAQAPQPDFSKVEIKTTKVTNSFYTLEGQGGTIGVLVGADGIFMVDSQFAPLSQKIAAAIHQISDKPIRFMVNTHVHGDHTGGNENFGKMGVTIFSRDELRSRLVHPAPGANGAPGTPAPSAALPVVTYDGPVTIHMDGEDVHLIPIHHAHTDGDTLVYFPNNDVLMTGDYYRSIQFPNIDRTNGGSLNGMLEGIGETIGLAGPNTKIIPGSRTDRQSRGIDRASRHDPRHSRQSRGVGPTRQDCRRGPGSQAHLRFRQHSERIHNVRALHPSIVRGSENQLD